MSRGPWRPGWTPPSRGGFPAHRVATPRLGVRVAVVALVALCAGLSVGPGVAAEPGSVAVDRLYRQGVRLLRQGQAVTAETVFQKVLRQAPDHFKTHLTLGKFYLSREPALAHHHLIIALTQRPGSDAVHYQLGRYLEGEEALPEAAESYRKAIALNPRNFRANDRLRGILRRLRAEQTVLERAAEGFLATPSVATLTHYGRIVMEYASPRQALWEFESMRERLPELPELNLWVARAQGRLGSLEGEITAYQAYLKKNREALRVRLVLLDRLLQVGAFRQAEETRMQAPGTSR